MTVRVWLANGTSPSSQPISVAEPGPAAEVSRTAAAGVQAELSALAQLTVPGTTEFGSMPAGNWSISDRL